MNGLVIDLFAGGGGASAGVEQAIGRAVDIAINHDPAAIRMHEANHPHTEHRCESIFDVDPIQATQGQPVALLWASPSCTHFSRARGGTPVSKQLRGLGWVVLRWAGKVRPAVIHCENVGEWQTWGPVRRGRPWARRKGDYFRLFVTSLERMGYAVEWRILDAADYGAGTHRRRLFLTARCDGGEIITPEPTHGPGRSRPFVTAADSIDWTDLGRSIFDRKKPLAPATCRRIAAGIVRYVLQGKPFLVSCAHGDFPTRNGSRCHPVDKPLGIITASNNHALCSAFLAKHFTGVIGQPCDRPLGTVTAVDHHSLVAAHLVTCNHQGEGFRGQSAEAPLSTITASRDARGLVAAHLTKFQQNGAGFQPDEPMHTVMAGAARFGLCAAFLTTYYSGGPPGARADDPMPVIVAKARHGLVVVEIEGQAYALADIRLRMLKPAELARAQGFPASYVLTGTQAEQIGRIGNSVCPPVAAALVRANLPQSKRATA